MVTVVGVMPVSDAEVLVDPPPLLPPQAATTAAAAQMDPTTAVFDLLIRELMPGPPWECRGSRYGVPLSSRAADPRVRACRPGGSPSQPDEADQGALDPPRERDHRNNEHGSVDRHG